MAPLRQGLLDGRSVAAAALPGDIADTLRGLGATVIQFEADPAADEDMVGEWARGRAPLDALVCDTRTAFGAGGVSGVLAAHEHAWVAAREVAVGALIPAEEGQIVLVAPASEAGAMADSVRAGLENLARTLSIEWARFGVRTVAIAPGADTAPDDLGGLLAFLCSHAGGYLSGCRLELGAVTQLSA